MFYVFFYFSNVFCAFLMSCFCYVQNYKYDAFLMGKDPFPGQSECFVAALLTLLCIDGASYLNGYRSLMFLCMF